MSADKAKSTLAKLSQDQQDEIFRLVEKGTLVEAQKKLADRKIQLSLTSISRWATKERERRLREKFSARLIELTAAKKNAESISTKVGDLGILNDQNLALLSQTYFNAQVTGDMKTMTLLGEQLTFLMDAVAKIRRANAALADSATAREKFEFDAAKLALKYAAELQDISKSSGSQREKAARAVERMFGKRPSQKGGAA